MNPTLTNHQGRYSSSSCSSCPPGKPQLALSTSIQTHHAAVLPPTETFPLQLPMTLQVPSVTFAAPAMAPPLTACVLPRPRAAGVLPGCPRPPCHLPADTDQCLALAAGGPRAAPLWGAASPRGAAPPCPCSLSSILRWGTAGDNRDTGATPANGTGAVAQVQPLYPTGSCQPPIPA